MKRHDRPGRWKNRTLLYVNTEQRRRPACMSEQSDQRLIIHYREIIVHVFKPDSCKVSVIYKVSVAQQTGLRFAWSETPKTGFLA